MANSTQILSSSVTGRKPSQQEQEPTPTQIDLKLLVVGVPNAGKSSILDVWVAGKEKFDSRRSATINVEYHTKAPWKYVSNTHTVPVMINPCLWDIAGQDRQPVIARAFAANAHGVFVVTDYDRLFQSASPEGECLQTVNKWKKSVMRVVASSSIPCCVLVNKSDLAVAQQHKSDFDKDISKFVRDEEIDTWYATSAKTGSNINSAIQSFAEYVVDKMSVDQMAALEQERINSDAFGIRSSGGGGGEDGTGNKDGTGSIHLFREKKQSLKKDSCGGCSVS